MVRGCTCVCIYLCMHLCMYACVYVCTYACMQLDFDRRSATFAALIFSTVDLMYRAKKAKEFFPCSTEFFSLLSPVQQIDHAIFTQLQYKE